MTSPLAVAAAARAVLDGGVVAYPTEAVYGLGCLPRDETAVSRILRMKRRSWRKGLLLIAADLETLMRYVALERSPLASEILASWPGPYTWVLPARADVPEWLTGRRGSIGVRLTAHAIAAELASRVGDALVSTSANVSRRPPARTALAARRAVGREVDYVLSGKVGGGAKPTSIRDGMTGAVLRPS
ncbi:MAG TPA: L-threonylcarbamoyladenylate synthase [Gammaproteobacteria bacterium]|nr:L-threonylcarbamoyladenylate synthase [Gammaproteobacteria bacterium]